MQNVYTNKAKDQYSNIYMTFTIHIYWCAIVCQPCQVHHDSVSNGWRRIGSSTSWVQKQFDHWRHIFNTLLCFFVFLFCIRLFKDLLDTFVYFVSPCVNVALYTQTVVEIKTVRWCVWFSCRFSERGWHEHRSPHQNVTSVWKRRHFTASLRRNLELSWFWKCQNETRGVLVFCSKETRQMLLFPVCFSLFLFSFFLTVELETFLEKCFCFICFLVLVFVFVNDAVIKHLTGVWL